MFMKTLEINKFKSIKNPVSLDMTSGLIVIIGKNGTGKTNILDAMFTLFSTRYLNEGIDFDYRIDVELETVDFASFSDITMLTDQDKIVQAYWKKGTSRHAININHVRSSFLVALLNRTEGSIIELTKTLQKALHKLNQSIHELIDEDCKARDSSLHISQEGSSTLQSFFRPLDALQQMTNELMKSVKEILKDKRGKDEIRIGSHLIRTWDITEWSKSLELKYRPLELSKLERRYITIDEAAIEQKLTEINATLSKEREAIRVILKKLEAKLDNFNALILDNEWHDTDSKDIFQSVLKRVIRACNPKVYYLRNENAQLFFDAKQRWDIHRYVMDERTIINAFLEFKYKHEHSIDIKNQLDSNALSSDIKKKMAKDLEETINQNLPEYEKDLISQVKVSNDLTFSIVEKSGDVIPFSETNAGRRWFFTYFFVKGCLRPGDMLLMDEPANHLHPEAQVAIRKDIEQLAQDHQVIMTTHSPYMISTNARVYYVEIDSMGTRVTEKDNQEMHALLKELKVFRGETILNDFLLKNQLLAFDEIGLRIKETLKSMKITQEKAADQLGIEFREFRRKLKGKHLTIGDVKNVCKTFDISPMQLLFKDEIG